MSQMVTAITASAIVLASVAALAQPQAPFALTLTQQFGRGFFNACQLEVVVSQEGGRSNLHCARGYGARRDINAQRPLTVTETATITALESRSDLFASAHAGEDPRGSDGILETLVVRKGKRAEAFVSSGNPEFEVGERRKLIDMLRGIMDGLIKRELK